MSLIAGIVFLLAALGLPALRNHVNPNPWNGDDPSDWFAAFTAAIFSTVGALLVCASIAGAR